MKHALFIASLALMPRLAGACTVCFGDPNSPTGEALGVAILFLLGVVGMVMTGIGGFFFHLARRAKSPLLHPDELTLPAGDGFSGAKPSHR